MTPLTAGNLILTTIRDLRATVIFRVPSRLDSKHFSRSITNHNAMR